jgi:hypothetical protein
LVTLTPPAILGAAGGGNSGCHPSIERDLRVLG